MAKTPTKKGKKPGKGGIHPPEEHQFKKGEVHNPNGPPKARTQFYRYFCKYLDMTKPQLERLLKKKDKLKLVQIAAIENALRVAKGDWPRAKEIIDRDGRHEQGADETVNITIEYVGGEKAD